MPFPTHERDPFSTDELFDLADGNGSFKISVVGQIVYKDDLGNARTTWFCRERKYGQGRFLPVDNPDYESAD